jgi:hypothetical protein
VCKSDKEYIPLSGCTDNPVLLQTVFWIHDILEWIRIWICIREAQKHVDLVDPDRGHLTSNI